MNNIFENPVLCELTKTVTNGPAFRQSVIRFTYYIIIY